MDVRRQFRDSRTERGAVAMLFAFALPVMLGMMALALDLAYQYVRRTELQHLADNIALAAAGKLNGTAQGVTAAKAAAITLANNSYIDFNRTLVYWDHSALKLASSSASDATWVDATSITTDAAAAGMLYAKVDTSRLSGVGGEDLGLVDALMGAVLDDGTSTSMSASAVAGPSTVQVTPLAICPISQTAAGTYDHSGTGIANETLEYGFRRGVSYNLLGLGPTGTAQAYLVNPVDPGTGSTNDVHHFEAAYVKKFFCNGTMAFREVGANSKLHVATLTLEIKDWLNSRFNDFSGPDACTGDASSSDSDIREYIGKQGTIYPAWYMATTPDPYPRTAAPFTSGSGSPLVTVADLPYAPTGTAVPAAASFGPLWTYSKPVGYGTSDWPKLYANNGVSVPVPTGYPTSGFPYQNASHRVSVGQGTKDRRVLNIPLLECLGGTPAAPARVLGIGRFFMTSKAVPGVVPGEFAGMAQFGVGSGSAALYK
jgi:Flp pilus assembly protein TadG